MRYLASLCPIFVFFYFNQSLIAQCSNPDYSVLASIYNDYDGANWRYISWDLQDCDICDWQGVMCNANDRVIEVALHAETTFTELPPAFTELEYLENLFLDRNKMETVSPEVLRGLRGLKQLDLYGNLFTAFPDSMGYLENLTFLNLSFNNFNDSIPQDFGNMQKLETLRLFKSNVIGPIPAGLASISTLTYLELKDNLFDSFPVNLCDITSLKNLYLSNNNFNDFIPTEIGKLVNLKVLDMANSNLVGNIPIEIGNLQSLKELNISYCNLWGSIPIEIGNLQQLNQLQLHNNNLSGAIPKEIFLPVLGRLNISHNLLSGQIPDEIGNSNGLSWLDMNTNFLSGSIPSSIGNLHDITTVDLSNNRLTGSIPEEFGDVGSNSNELEEVLLSNNMLSGPIPKGLGNLFFAGDDDAILDLSNNQLTGSIPVELFAPFIIDDLAIYLYNNQLSGCYDLNLKGVDYDPCQYYTNAMISDGNNFDAAWEDFCNNDSGTCIEAGCQNLDYRWLASLYVDLDGDNWTTAWDTLDCNICNWYGVTCDSNNRVIQLSLADNNLSGDFPLSIQYLSRLESISFEHNRISGPLPKEVSKLNQLQTLNLQYNLIDTLIGFRGYFRIKELRLNDNNIQGVLPRNFKVTEVLTLQNNYLVGELPYYFFVGRVFRIDNNQLSGTIDNLNLLYNSPRDTFNISNNNFIGCYDGKFKQELCGFTNAVISDMNNFDSTWEDFCNCQAGICKTETVNVWRGEGGLWNNPDNWSLGHIPLRSESVLILPKYYWSGDFSVVTVPENFQASIYSLEVQLGAILNIPLSSELEILTDSGWLDVDQCE